MKVLQILLTASIATFLAFACVSPHGATAGTGLTPEQRSLLSFSRGYELPDQDVPPKAHEDSKIASIVIAMQDIAGKQDLVFDGHKANEGFVVVGKQCKNDEIILIFKLYRAGNGRIAFQDIHLWNGADMSEGMQMRSRFLSALQ